MVHEPDPNSPLGQFQQRARRVPAPIRGLFVVAAIGLTGYCVVADTGPYRFLAETQASFMHGKHYIMLSGMLTLLLFLLPAIVVLQLLAGLFAEKPPAGPPHAR
jgi:hypothetical protein